MGVDRNLELSFLGAPEARATRPRKAKALMMLSLEKY